MVTQRHANDPIAFDMCKSNHHFMRQGLSWSLNVSGSNFSCANILMHTAYVCFVNRTQQSNEVPKSCDTTSKVICCPSSFPEASPLQWQIHSSSHGPQFWEAYKGSQGSNCLVPFVYYQFHIKIKIGFFLGSIPRNQNPITDNYYIFTITVYLDMSLH